VAVVVVGVLLISAAAPPDRLHRGREFPVRTASSSPAGISAGPDGNMWFTEYGLAYDAAHSKVLMFGGGYGSMRTSLDDTWEWNGTDWCQVGAPPAC
jgi:hypothetical protein